MRVTCAAALLVQCFAREVKVLPGAEEGETPTEKANTRGGGARNLNLHVSERLPFTRARHVQRLESMLGSTG